MHVSLDLPFEAEPERWAQLLQRIQGWDEETRPRSLHRLTDPDPPEEEPWTPEREAEALRRLAEGERFSWQLFGADEVAISLSVGRSYVGVSTITRRPPEASTRVAELLRSLQGGVFPRLAMAWAYETADDELLMQGLHRLADVPPVLFLDAAILDKLGARAELAKAGPATAIADGLLLSIADPWKKKDPEGARQRKAVARILGMSPSHPLSLL
jgi:hypothetical protein